MTEPGASELLATEPQRAAAHGRVLRAMQAKADSPIAGKSEDPASSPGRTAVDDRITRGNGVALALRAPARRGRARGRL